MNKPAVNLKRLLEYLNISNAYLAKSIIVDASLISRWLNGHRRLKLSSEFMDKLSDYLLNRVLAADGLDWLKRQMELDGLLIDYTLSGELQNGLKLWLSTDGENMVRVFNRPSVSAGKDVLNAAENRVQTGYAEIAMFIETTLNKISEGSQISIHLSNEDTGILLQESIRHTLLDSISHRNLKIRLLISLSNNTRAMSQLLSRYIQAIIEGALSVSVVHGITQAITNQATFIFVDNMALIVCETPKNIAPPIGMITRDERFVKECGKSFERAYNYSHQLLQRYDDNYSRNILEILYQEFAMPGNLDIIKDSINPMYMTADAYDRFLMICEHKGEQFKWRSAEFVRFKTGLDDNLKSGTIFREILPLDRLKQIALEGKCKMPALYFMYAGMVYLDAAGCLSIIEGYVDYLKRMPNFNLLILTDVSELHENNCWQLKQNSHVAINGWSKDEHIILYSNQLMLTHEFQTYFDGLWNKEHYSEGLRKKTILALEDIAEQIKANHALT
jgi:transcriptional regulator with XRE-family HTH domain